MTILKSNQECTTDFYAEFYQLFLLAGESGWFETDLDLIDLIIFQNNYILHILIQ